MGDRAPAWRHARCTSRLTMNERLRRNRDLAVHRFLRSGLAGTLHVRLSADDLLDGDLYWESSPLAFVAKQTVLVLDESVSSIDEGVLIVCLRELKSLGFSFSVVEDDHQSTSTQRPVFDGVRDAVFC